MEIQSRSPFSADLARNTQTEGRVQDLARRASAGKSAAEDQKLKEVCSDFESIFIEQVFKQMRNSLKIDKSILHGGMAEDIFTDMLYQEYSKEAARRNSFGISGLLYDFLTQNPSMGGK